MHEHALDAVLERHSAAIARATRATQLQQNLPIDETAEIDIAAVFLDSGADAGLEELLDHADDLAVVLVVGEGVDLGALLAALVVGVGHGVDDGLARRHELADEGEDLGLDVRPRRRAVLGYRDVVCAEENGGYAVDVEEGRGERGGVRRRERRARREVLEGGDGFREDSLVGFEFEGLGRLVSVATVALHCVARGGKNRTSGFGVDSWSVWMNMVRRPRGARGACMVDVHGEGRTLHCRGEDVRGLVF